MPVITQQIEHLRHEFNNRVQLVEKRPGILQLYAPFYHDDGDMYELFLEDSPLGNEWTRITDHGMTLMRLSYHYELDTPVKKKIFNRIVAESRLTEMDGRLSLDVAAGSLYAGVMSFVKAISNVSNMRLYKREVVRNLFYEQLAAFVTKDLPAFAPSKTYYPIVDRDDLEVDYLIAVKRPIYLFGVLDDTKARLVTIACQAFQLKKIEFRSVIVHEDFESLSVKDRKRLTNVVDKQFTSLDEFIREGRLYLQREVA